MTALVELSLAIAVSQLWLLLLQPYSHLSEALAKWYIHLSESLANCLDDVPFWLKNSEARSLASSKKSD